MSFAFTNVHTVVGTNVGMLCIQFFLVSLSHTLLLFKQPETVDYQCAESFLVLKKTASYYIV